MPPCSVRLSDLLLNLEPPEPPKLLQGLGRSQGSHEEPGGEPGEPGEPGGAWRSQGVAWGSQGFLLAPPGSLAPSWVLLAPPGSSWLCFAFKTKYLFIVVDAAKHPCACGPLQACLGGPNS